MPSRYIIRWFTTRHHKYVFVADAARPASMEVCLADDPKKPIVIGIFPKMTGREQAQWLANRLDRVLELQQDFAVFKDYTILYDLDSPKRMDTAGLDMTPPERRGWISAEEEDRGPRIKKGERVVHFDLPKKPGKAREARKRAVPQKNRSSSPKSPKLFR